MPIDHVDVFAREAAALLATARRPGALTAAVPSCPGWDVLQLLRHAGRTQRWAGLAVTTGLEPEREAMARAPQEPDEVLAWFAEGAAELEATLRAAPAERPAWHFTSGPQVVATWSRRMAHETAVHRWDAQQAVGTPEPIDAELAADGVDELLTLFVPRGAPTDPADLPAGSVHVHATDTAGEWTLHAAAGGPVVERGHDKGDATVRGPAGDLLLLWWGRIDRSGDSLTVFGDAAVLDAWLATGQRWSAAGPR